MLDEAKKREKVANAFLAATMAASAAQSPKDFVRTGHIESPGTALMQMWAKKRGEAERNLDHGRVSHAARNRKKKSVEESKEHTMKEVETKLPKGHKLKNERKGKGDHVFFDVVDDKGNAIQTPVPVGGAKKGKNKYSSSLKGTATNAGNFIKKVHQAIDDVQAEKDEPSTADRMSAAVKKRISDMSAKDKYKKASSILRTMKRKTFEEFFAEAYLVEMRKEDKVKGEKKTPLYVSKTSGRVVKNPETGRSEVKKSTRTSLSPRAATGRIKQGMKDPLNIYGQPETYGATRHAHGGGGSGAKAPGRKRGVGKLEQQKIDKAQRERGERPLGSGPSPEYKVALKKSKRTRSTGGGR